MLAVYTFPSQSRYIAQKCLSHHTLHHKHVAKLKDKADWQT